MRDVIRGAGEPDPPPTPVAPRAAVSAPAPPAAAQADGDADAVFAAVRGSTEELREAVAGGGPLPIATLEAAVLRAIESLEHGSELFWLATAPAPAGADPVAAHLARVGVLALRIGADLGYDRPQLIDLGLAALLSDIGLWKLPPRLRQGEARTPDEEAQYQTHPRLAAELIRGAASERARLVDAVLEHHEREQGQGYPQRLPGSAIHPHAKIIGLVDTYARLTAPPPPQARLMPHEAIREIVRSKREAFPSALVKALLSEISVFPPRTLVRLNTGEVGRVVAVNRNHPLRPKVEIVADSKGDRLHAPKLVDLSEAPFVYITASIQESRS